MSEILQWTMNYCKLFATTKRTISSIFYICRHELNIYGPERCGKFGIRIAADADPGWKSWKHPCFFTTELNSLTFFWWECFDSFTNSCDFQTTSALQVKHAHTPGARWQDVYFLVVSLLLLLLFLEEIHFLQLLYTARGSQNARNPGFSVFQVWPLDVDDQFARTETWIRKTPDEAPSTVICPNMFKAETFFQVTTLLPIDGFHGGCPSSGQVLQHQPPPTWDIISDFEFVKGCKCPRWQKCPPKYILMSWQDSHPNMMDGWTLDFVLSTSFRLMEGVPPSELIDDLW